MPTQRIALTGTYQSISSGGSPRLAVRGHDNIRLVVAAAQPAAEATDYFTMHVKDGPMDAIPVPAGMQLWARSSGGQAVVELLDAGNGDGAGANSKQRYQLLTNMAAAGSGPQVGPIAGGDYIFRAEAANWNGATATVKYLGLDGATWFTLRNLANSADIALSANGFVTIGVAQGAILRIDVAGGNPTGLNAAIGGL